MTGIKADTPDGPRVPLEDKMLREYTAGYVAGYEEGAFAAFERWSEKKVLWFAMGAASAILGSQLYRMAELWWGW